MPRLILMLALLLFGAAAPASAQTFPKFTGLVVDDANVLPPDVEASLTQKLDALQRDTKRQLVVVTVADAQGYPLSDYGYQLGRAWKVGLADADNGVILLIAPNNPKGQRGPRIEVGRGLEPIVTDALAGTIIRNDMLPQLREGNVPQAMVAGADALIAQLRAAPEEAQAKVDAAVQEFNRTHQRKAGGGGIGIGGILFWLFVFFIVIIPLIRRARGRRYRGGDSDLPIVLWTIGSEIARHSGGWSSGGGGWSSGDSGGGGGGWGDGGFTGGGGGDFGGGGASGDW
jgi:uncharacterized protein